jgi:conjugal transfer pilus assembly protein TraF
MKKAIVLVMVCLILAQTSYGHSEFYKDKKRGWFWFEQRKQKDNDIGNSIDNKTATSKLQDFQKELEEAKSAMIMKPSIANAKSYIKLQNEMFEKATRVAKAWQAAMLMYPEINLVKDTPISQAGMNITRELEAKGNEKAIREFASKYQLLFFYKSDCRFCTAFTEVLELLIAKYRFRVASVTLDGGIIRKFPAKINTGLINQLNVKSAPSLFAFSEEEGVVMPISHGFATLDALEKNLIFVIGEMKKL